MKIKFLGAAREVTGSKHLIITQSGRRILLDCGMYQGKGLETDSLNRKLGFNPAEIDYLVLSHAHIDHSGLIPYIYKLGFRGSIICTSATRDLCSIMLADSGYIQEHDTRTFNKKRAWKGLEPVEPLYTKDDALEVMQLFIGIAYNRTYAIDRDITVEFTHTGHMLGGGVANLVIKEGDRTHRIAYTGDIGRPVNRILAPPKAFPQADYLITEATYGDRLHHDNIHAEKELLRVIHKTCVEKKGKLIIPSFSVGRTQDIVYTLNNFYNEGRLPRIDIYVDSPLAVNATEIFRLHPECFNRNILEIMERDPDPFGFNSLHYIKMAEDSKKLNKIKEPVVIISASGMMEAGRVKHHLANSISDSKNTVLAVGYCAPRTLGARLLRGEKEISIHGNRYVVEADIERIDSYSGHGDYKEMAEFLLCQDPGAIKQTFLVHGEIEAQTKYRDYLETRGFNNIHIPDVGQEFGI
ncbi:MAG: MBL fold metallo-hydrolase [Marinilabiliaceae bacterium]|jgi:metallo-beta-lactamase family protein|nr:MBL fold metallo-hydrolase [Marinilabiliaceae bacterium]